MGNGLNHPLPDAAQRLELVRGCSSGVISLRLFDKRRTAFKGSRVKVGVRGQSQGLY